MTLASSPPAHRRSRLVLWFVLVATLGLLIAGAGILVVVERALTRQGERHAVDQARVATHALLDRRLRPGDFTGSLTDGRRRQLSALFSQDALGRDLTGATVYGPRGVVFTTAPAGALASVQGPLRRALDDQVVSDVASLSGGRVLRAFLPIALRDGQARGVVELDEDYAPIAAAARRSSLLIVAVLEALLVALCLCLVPVLARASNRMERQVDELDSLERADGLKSEMVSTVSHELRTPLTAVLGFSQLLMDDGTVDEESRRHYLATIHGEAERLNGLIDEFLDLQKMEAGHFDLARESFRLDDVLAHEVEVFGMQSAIHTLDLDVTDRPLAIVGDEGRITRVVANLLSNAIKYSPDGGVVRVRALVTDGSVRVAISDSGIGIPSDQQDQVFNQFFRVDSADTRTIRGTGLGLSLCQEIVEAHDGRIGVESNEGQGSTFWFELPAPASLAGAA